MSLGLLFPSDMRAITFTRMWQLWHVYTEANVTLGNWLSCYQSAFIASCQTMCQTIRKSHMLKSPDGRPHMAGWPYLEIDYFLAFQVYDQCGCYFVIVPFLSGGILYPICHILRHWFKYFLVSINPNTSLFADMGLINYFFCIPFHFSIIIICITFMIIFLYYQFCFINIFCII